MSPLGLGARGRCPRCGEGKLFKGIVAFAPACPKCELDLTAFNVGDGAAPFLILIEGAIVVVGAVTLEFTAHPPWWVHALIWPPLMLAITLGLLRVAKGMLLATEYRHKAAEHRAR